MTAAIRIDSDDLYPRDDAHRFRLYGRERGGSIVVRACAPDAGGVGVALVTLAEERRDAGLDPEIVGVLDAVEHRWLTSMWEGRS